MTKGDYAYRTITAGSPTALDDVKELLEMLANEGYILLSAASSGNAVHYILKRKDKL